MYKIHIKWASRQFFDASGTTNVCTGHIDRFLMEYFTCVLLTINLYSLA